LAIAAHCKKTGTRYKKRVTHKMIFEKFGIIAGFELAGG
jgi:hypothetical protein